MFTKSGNYKTGKDALSRVEYEKLISKIDNYEDLLLIKLAVAGGFRRDDIVNIEIKNINFLECKISFFEKKKSAIHTVWLANSLMIEIERFCGTLPKNQEFLFNFNDKTAYNRFQKYCVKAEIRKRPFHALRATCIKFCQLADWSIEKTAAHVNDTVSVIQNHYSVPSDQERKEEAQRKPIV